MKECLLSFVTVSVLVLMFASKISRERLNEQEKRIQALELRLESK